MNYIKNLFESVIAGKQKAIAAFVVAGISSYIARHGLTMNTSGLAYLQAAVIGAIAHAGVFFTANS